jgi:uncharacterized protein (DUF427 family)
MPRAIWNGIVVAQSNRTEIVEGNHYFPPEAIHKQYFRDSATHTECSWKGTASYFDLEVEGKTNKDAAWYYPKPSPEASKIAGYIAFWNGVQVES